MIVRVQLLSPYTGLYKKMADIITSQKNVTMTDIDPDLTVLWGHRSIFSPLELVGKLIINIHISYLPYNRGAHPNLWSWYDNTPKGVTIHKVTDVIDGGPILIRKQLIMNEETETLRTSYDRLQFFAIKLFGELWPDLRNGNYDQFSQVVWKGSYHTTIKSNDLMRHFQLGFDTPVKEVADFGRAQRKERI